MANSKERRAAEHGKGNIISMEDIARAQAQDEFDALPLEEKVETFKAEAINGLVAKSISSKNISAWQSMRSDCVQYLGTDVWEGYSDEEQVDHVESCASFQTGIYDTLIELIDGITLEELSVAPMEFKNPVAEHFNKNMGFDRKTMYNAWLETIAFMNMKESISEIASLNKLVWSELQDSPPEDEPDEDEEPAE